MLALAGCAIGCATHTKTNTMSKARPLQKTPKKRIWLTGHKSKFQNLKGMSFDQISTGFAWEVGPLLRIEEVFSDPDDRDSYSHTLMLWQVACTGCGTEQILDRREIKRGANCPVCRAVQKPDKVQKEREAILARAQRTAEKERARAQRIQALTIDYLSGMSLSEVGEKHGLHYTRVWQLLRKAGVPLRTQGHNHKPPHNKGRGEKGKTTE